MKRKQGISLIILVITIIIMIILAAAVVVTLSNTGIFNKADEAVNKSELKQVENLATMAWADAYMEGKRTQPELLEYVMNILKNNKINTDKYAIIVTTKGVAVKLKNDKEDENIEVAGGPGLYETGSNYTKLLLSWDYLIENEGIIIEDGAAFVGHVVPITLKDKNEYGFYYGVTYIDNGWGFTFYKDGSLDVYMDNRLIYTSEPGVAVYSKGTIDLTELFDGEYIVTISQSGNMLFDNGNPLYSEPYYIPEKNEYGFYYDIRYMIDDGNGIIFYEDGSVGLYCGPIDFLPAGSYRYNNGVIDLSELLGIKFTFSSTDGIFRDEEGGEWIPNYLLYPMQLKGDLLLPDDGTITRIAASSFEYQPITDIVIPEGVTIIEEDAFSYCRSLLNVTIPKSVTKIEEGAFNYCSAMKELVVKEGSELAEIAAGAFNNCNSLESMTMPFVGLSRDNRTSFAKLFWTSGGSIPDALETLILTDETEIPANAFSVRDNEEVKITTVIINEGVTSIGRGAFRKCRNLVDIKLPESVTYIGEEAFDYTNIHTLEIPKNVTSIDGGLSRCLNLETIIVDKDNPNYYSENNCLIEKDTKTLLAVNKNGIMPNNGSIAIVADSVFSGNTNITNIKIPEGVTTLGTGVFTECTNLKTVEFPSSITSIGAYAFYGCTALTTVTFDENVKFEGDIGEYTFYQCKNLNSIVIPEGVTTIGYMAFRETSGLTSVTIPVSLTKFDDYSFSFSNINDIYYAGTMEQWKAIKKINNCFYFAGGDVIADYIIHCADGDI